MAGAPINDVLVDGTAVSKGDFRVYEETRLRIRMANAAEVNATDLAGVLKIEIDGLRFDFDGADTTSADDGIAVLVDSAGHRFKLVDSWITVRKISDEIITADNVLTADAALSFAMVAGRKYLVRGRIFFDTTANADIKFRHAGPSSPVLVRIARKAIAPGATADSNVAVDTAFSASDIAVTGSGTDGGTFSFEGIVHNGANAGTFAIQWAQNVSDAGNTTVRAGSYLEYRPLV